MLPISPGLFSRRDFLARSIAATSLVASGCHPAQARQLDVSALESGRRLPFLNIDFPTTVTTLSPELKALYEAITRFQEKRARLFSREAAALPRVLDVQRSVPPSTLTDQKRSLWIEIGRIPGAFLPSPSYSDQACHQFLMQRVPHIFAPYGIFVAVDVFILRHQASLQFLAVEPRLNFWEVSQVGQGNFTQWGRHGSAPIVHLGRKLHGVATIAAGESIYRSVVFTEELLASAVQELKKAQAAALHQVDNLERYLDDARYATARVPPEQQLTTALEMVVPAILSLAEVPDATDKLKKHIAPHEFSHILDIQDGQSFMPITGYGTVWNQRSMDRVEFNASTHREINGFLGELRYSPFKACALANMLGSARAEADAGPGYARASMWIVNLLVANLEKPLRQSGYAFGAFPGLHPWTESLLMLPRLLREQPALLNQIWEALYALHKSKSTDDLSGVPDTGEKPRPLDPGVMNQIGLNSWPAFTIGAGAAVVAGAFLRRHFGHNVSRKRIQK